jgi:hypothetical protein
MRGRNRRADAGHCLHGALPSQTVEVSCGKVRRQPNALQRVFILSIRVGRAGGLERRAIVEGALMILPFILVVAVAALVAAYAVTMRVDAGEASRESK